MAMRMSGAASALDIDGFRADMASIEEEALARSDLSLSDYLSPIEKYSVRHFYRRNDTIFHQKDPVDNLYKVISGTVRLSRHLSDARRHIVDFILPGEILALWESPDHPVSAEAADEVLLIAYPRVCVDELARRNAAVSTQLLCQLSSNLLTAQHHLMILGCQNAKERVASFLLRFADRSDICEGEQLELVMGRQDIADHLGITIETLCRVITSLRGSGLITVPNAHAVVLNNILALRSLAAED